jgi:hypothetical protein
MNEEKENSGTFASSTSLSASALLYFPLAALSEAISREAEGPPGFWPSKKFVFLSPPKLFFRRRLSPIVFGLLLLLLPIVAQERGGGALLGAY